MNHSIKHLFHIDASLQKVFEALSTIKGLSNWWTTQTKGITEKGGTIQFDFGTYIGPKMKVLESTKSKKVVWECMGIDNGWEGHIFTFSLDENDGKTRIRFSHEGWEENGDFYAQCNFSWGRYMESLRQYCQTGKGEAFGSAGYR